MAGAGAPPPNPNGRNGYNDLPPTPHDDPWHDYFMNFTLQVHNPSPWGTAGTLPLGGKGIFPTGRFFSISLAEQLAMQQAKSNPAGGTVIEELVMGDWRWPASEGWVKMRQNINGIEIHYAYNEGKQVWADFKFTGY